MNMENEMTKNFLGRLTEYNIQKQKLGKVKVQIIDKVLKVTEDILLNKKALEEICFDFDYITNLDRDVDHLIRTNSNYRHQIQKTMEVKKGLADKITMAQDLFNLIYKEYQLAFADLPTALEWTNTCGLVNTSTDLAIDLYTLAEIGLEYHGDLLKFNFDMSQLEAAVVISDDLGRAISISNMMVGDLIDKRVLEAAFDSLKTNMLNTKRALRYAKWKINRKFLI